MGYSALLFCPDEKLARVVSQVFSELDFVVEPVTDPFAAVQKLMAQHYDAIVVDCDSEQNSSLLLKSGRNSSFNQGTLAIALVEGQTGVAKAYRIGANLVLTKPINLEQAKGTLRVARGLLRKGSDTAATASHAASNEVAKEVATGTGSIEPANRSLEAIAAPPAYSQAPEFKAPLSVMAASTKIEEQSAPDPAPQAQAWTDLVAQVPAAPAAVVSLPVVTEKEPPKTEASTPTAVPVFGATSGSPGAASAPAPAKEVVAAPAKKEEEKKRKEFEETKATAPAEVKLSSGVASTTDDPAFSAAGHQNAGGSGGSKKMFIAAVAVLAVAAAGYYGWTEFGHTSSAPQVLRTAPQKPAVTVSSPAPASTLVPARAAGGNNPANATTTTASVSKTSSAQLGESSTDASSETQAGGSHAAGSQNAAPRIAIRLGSEAKEIASAPLRANSGAPAVKTQAQTEEEVSVEPPSPLAVTSQGDSGMSAVLSSTSPNVPKPVLATVKVSQGVSQGMVIKRVQPKYPANALAAHIQGVVQIEATVDKQGNVVNARVLSGDPVLAAAALEAVRQWRYKPYYLDREPVEIQTQISVHFKAN